MTLISKKTPSVKAIKFFLIGLYLIIIALVGIYSFRNPHHNWDMLAYMAVALKADKNNIDSIHYLTYRAAKTNIPHGDYANLIGGEKRTLRANDSRAFYKTLPFYAVKPAYVLSVRLFHKMGFTLPEATVLPSIFSFFLIGVLLMVWLSRYLKFAWSILISVLIIISGPMIFISRLSTPDAMSALFLFCSFYFIAEKQSTLGAFIFLLLSLTVRLDNIIPAAIILTFLFYSRKSLVKMRWTTYLSMAIILITSYFTISSLVLKPFDWGVLYYPSFSKYLNLPGTEQSVFSLKSYLELATSQLFSALINSHFVLFLLLLTLILYSPNFSFKKLSLDQLLSILFLLIILIRFLLFPDLADRFNIAYYLFFLITLVKRFTNTGFSLKTSELQNSKTPKLKTPELKT